MDGIPHHQHPLGPGFSAASTAADVLKGIDLTGRNVIITGGHSGIGRETTRALGDAGASVLVGVRYPDRAAMALSGAIGTAGVELDRLDLLDPASIDAFAARYRESGRPLHILINNAGIVSPTLGRDPRGYELQFATNHLGHFQLTLGLLPALGAAAGARVVTLSSWAHHFSDIDYEDPHFEHRAYESMTAHGQSKTANALFSVALDARLAGDGIRGYSLHPGGIVATNLIPSFRDSDKRAMNLIDADGRPIIDPATDRKSPQQGAATSVWAATSPMLADIGGVYLQDNDIAPLDEGVTADPNIGSVPVSNAVGVAPYAVDPASAQRLWELSERLTA
jgi:NAD(P)-dependent dehydrogenase (short-subunit alcohol dehydrogenase family)